MRSRIRGFSLVGLLVAISLIGVFYTFVSFDFKGISGDAKNGSNQLVGYLKLARAKAMATTKAYTITPTSSTAIVATYGTTCSAVDQTVDSGISFTLPGHSYLSDTNWKLCYSTRGIADNSKDIVVRDSTATFTIRVVLGGGVKVL